MKISAIRLPLKICFTTGLTDLHAMGSSASRGDMLLRSASSLNLLGLGVNSRTGPLLRTRRGVLAACVGGGDVGGSLADPASAT